MKKNLGKFLSYVLVAMAASVLTLAVSTILSGTDKLDTLQRYLTTYFVDGVEKEKLEDAAAYGMVEALGDRWSYYVPADQYGAFLANKNNAYVGIGVTIRSQEDGYLIIKLTEIGPAQASGMCVIDVSFAADGGSLVGLSDGDREALIKGEAGTTVQITVLREGQEHTFSVTRRTVQVKVATGTMLSDGVGLVKITNFNANCCKHTVEAVEALRSQGATAIIFDVRFNGGGYVTEMVELLDYLLPEGLLFQSEDYKGKRQEEYSDAAFLDLPMAVLVNGSSYSAAEFFAAALEEYDAAVIVGEKTSGKGYFQNTFLLPDGSAVAISTGKYYTPKGVSLEGVGLTPEVLVEVDAATSDKIYAEILEPQADPQIIAAINALKSAK